MGNALGQDWEPPVAAGRGLAPHLRLLSGLLADAVAMHASGIADGADIDTALRLGAGYAAGPFEVLDELDPTGATFGRRGAAQAPPAPPVDAGPWSGATGVVGTGHMASGIVEAIVRSGRRAVVLGRSTASLERLRASVAGRLDRSVAKGRSTADESARALRAIETDTDAQALADVDVVVEAVAEDLPLKQKVFAELDEALPAGLPLATNTSSYRVGEIASSITSGRPTLGLHFFNPAQVMKLVEVITADEDLAATAETWARALGKTPVRCADSRGFIVNRLLIPFLNDAVHTHELGLPVAEIDALMVERAGHPMGPFALIDLIGLDITVAALASMAETDPDPRLVPADTLRRLAAEGRLGRKSGRGFYDYADDAMTDDATTRLIRRYYDGCTAGDLEELRATLHPDVVHYFLAPNPGSTPVAGAEHLARYWRKVTRMIDARWVVDHVLARDDEAVIEWTMWWRPRGGPERIATRGAEWFVLRDGLIAEIRSYYQQRSTPRSSTPIPTRIAATRCRVVS